VVVLAGLVLIVPDFNFGNRVARGAFWGTISGLSFAVLSLLNKRLVPLHGPLVLAAGQDLVAAAVVLPLLPAGARWPEARDLLLLVILGVACTALAHTLFLKGLAAVRAQTAAVVTALEPVYGTVFAFLLLGEVPSARTLIGGSIILGAVTLSTLDRGRDSTLRPRAVDTTRVSG
jgi:drug/metabolite transporter (DMT)-like permease